MPTAFGPGCDPCLALDGPVLTIFAGAAISLPLTWWQVPPVYGPDGVTVMTPGVSVNMTGMEVAAEFLARGQSPGQGTPLATSLFVPLAGAWTVTGPGRGQPGDLTSNLPRGPASISGPQIRLTYTDVAGNPQIFGTYYLAVR